MTIGISSCSQKTHSIPDTDSHLQLSKTEFADTVFFKFISDINHHKDVIKLVDRRGYQVLSIDKSSNLLSTKKYSKGKGPKDANVLNKIIFSDSITALTDFGNSKVFISEKTSESTCKMKSIGSTGEIALTHNKMYYQSIDSNSHGIIAQLDLINRNIKHLKGTEQERPADKHILVLDNRIIQVVHSIKTDEKPTISIYSLSGDFVLSMDISDLFGIKKIVEVFKSKNYGPYASVVLFPAAKTYQDKFYLSFSNYDNEQNPQSFKILEFELIRDKIKPKRTINLKKDGWYETFDIINDTTLIAFDHVNNSIDTFTF